MKNNRKRLNNKGFTLIELLAVVVILAVVMGIAMSSVLTSMNSSRKGSLQNSAESTSQIFQNKYAEAMVTGGTNSVFGKYNFTSSGTVFYPLVESVASDLNLSKTSYLLSDSSEVQSGNAPTEAKDDSGNVTGFTYTASSSFVAFDGERIVACLVAQPSGSYYVGQAASNETADVLGVTVTFNAEGSTTVMYACSNEEVSWPEE